MLSPHLALDDPIRDPAQLLRRRHCPISLLPRVPHSIPFHPSDRAKTLSELRDALHKKYNIVLDANWMAAALGSDGAFTLPLSRLVKDRYEVFLFQCAWLLLGLVILKREAKPRGLFSPFSRTGAELLRDVSWCFQYAFLLHRGFGRARAYLGGVYAMKESFLDSVYYNMSSMVSDLPYETRESLEYVFGLCSQQQHALEQEVRGRSAEEQDAVCVRLFGLRFLNVIRCLWTNVRAAAVGEA